MPASITSSFPTEIDDLQAFFPMLDAPLGYAELDDSIGASDNFLPITDADQVFDPGPSLATIGGSYEIIYYDSAEADGLHGVERGVGDTLGINGVAGTAAGGGTVVRQLITNLQFRIVIDAIRAAQAKLGKDGDPDTSTIDYRVTQLEAAVGGDITRCAIINVPHVGCTDGDVVAWNGTEFVPAEVATSGSLPPVGVIYDISGANGNVALAGRSADHAGLTPGDIYYLDATGGGITAAPGEWQIGVAYSATQLMLAIKQVQVNNIVKLTGQPVEGSVVNLNVVSWDGGQWVKADADHATSTHRNALGIAINVGAGTADVVLLGEVSGYAGLSAGSIYYLSASTPGGMTTSKPATSSNVRGWICGIAKSTTVMLFNPSRDPYATEVPSGPSTAAFLLTAHGTVTSQFNLLDDYLKTLTHADVSATDPDTDVTGAELEQLTDGSETSLHIHDARYGYAGTLDKRYYEEMAAINDLTNSWNAFFSYPGGVGPTIAVDADGRWAEYLTTPADDDRNMPSALSIWRDHLPDIIWHIKTVSTASVRYWIGLWDDSGADILDSATPAIHMVGFRYDSAVDSGNGHWRCVSNDGGVTPTVTDSGVLIAINTVYDMRIVVGASNIKFYINGVLVATHTTDLPNTGVDLTTVCGVKRLGASERSVKLGWMKCRSK